IVWSSKAIADNLENISYLLNKWFLEVVLDYEKKIIETEDVLTSNPYAGEIVGDLSLRRILVVKQIYLMYEIVGDKILVVRIWNNYKKPYWLFSIFSLITLRISLLLIVLPCPNSFLAASRLSNNSCL